MSTRDNIAAFIRAYQDEHGFPPSMREVADAVGLRGPSTVHKHCSRLAGAGYLVQKEYLVPITRYGAPGAREIGEAR